MLCESSCELEVDQLAVSVVSVVLAPSDHSRSVAGAGGPSTLTENVTEVE